MNRLVVILLVLMMSASVVAAGKVPTTIPQIAADFDPSADPLDIQVVREWEEDGLVLRYVTFHVGTFKGRSARMAAFY